MMKKPFRNTPHQRNVSSVPIKSMLALFLFFGSLPAAVIQKGMILSIMVKGDELLTQQVKVEDDGTVDYPLYQDTPITGMTTSEFQNILTVKLANYTDVPFVLVTILDELPITVYVLGQIKNPGPVRVPPNASLQEVLKAAGGPSEYGNLERVKVLHTRQTDEEAAYYNLQEFMLTGNLSMLPKIQDLDKIIILSSRKNTKIKVLGAVNNPGYYDALDSSTIFDIIYLAGGPVADANLQKIRILSSIDSRETDAVIDLQKYLDKGKLSEVPFVTAGDVVIVYRKTFTWGKSLAVVRDVATLVTAFIIISNFNQIFPGS